MPGRRLPRCKVVCFQEHKIAALQRQLPAPGKLLAEARRHKVLGHPARLAILHLLALDECCVCDLANILGKPVSTVSQHLQGLSSAGFIRSRPEGKLVFYSPVPEGAPSYRDGGTRNHGKPGERAS